jgi:preprotein translocase subunit SecD
LKKVIGKILLIIVPILVALLLLYPTFKANQLINKQQKAFAQAEKAGNPADSIKIIEDFEKTYGEELQSAKSNRLKLGLDLRGGMYVTLEVDVLKLLEEAADKDAIDETFNKVIEKTKKETENTDLDVIDVFTKNFDEIARPKRKYLSDYYDFGGDANIADTEEKIVDKLKENELDAIDQAIQVIRQRVDKYGIAEPTIQKVGARRILLELPGVTNEKEMRHLLQTTARLEFKLVRSDENLVSAFYKIDKYLANENKLRKEEGLDKTETATDTTAVAADTTNKENVAEGNNAQDTTASDTTNAVAEADTANPYAGLSEDEVRKQYLEDHPFTTLFSTVYLYEDRNRRPEEVNYAINNFPKGDYNFQIFEPYLKKFNRILARPDIQELLPYGVEIKFLAKPQIYKDKNGQDIKAYSFFGLKKEPELTGEHITNAAATFDPTNNQPIVNMSMDDEGSDKWAQITGANIKKRIAIVLDDQIYSAPVVNQKIIGGNSQITGMADAEEARLLKIVLKAGALKAPVRMIEERVVGPSLGEDSIQKGLTSFLIAAILVILFMLLYYNVAGLIANLAIMINVLLILAILAAFQGTLTLPGIAGIILTIGMAVDANILIFERIREELLRGRSLRSAVDEGFGKALSAILDSNITTFLTGMILYFVGTGPIQGFALTLMIGILGTLFTGVYLSKKMFEILLARGITSFNFGQPKTKEA